MNNPIQNKYYIDLIKKIETKQVKIGIIGIGYVGLPLALSFSRKGIKVIGFDNNKKVIKTLKDGLSHINHIDAKEVERGIKSQSFLPTDDFSLIKNLDVILICLPTPLNKLREPDLSFITQTITSIRDFLKKGQLISIESTTYPGATYEIIRPLIEFNDIEIGNNFFLTYSPERVDPGNKDFKIDKIPKVIGGDSRYCVDVGKKTYELINLDVVLVSSSKAAEMTKLLENVYRSVNIGLINELKILAENLDLDIYEIIKAAASKPFGFKPFFPGPGVGGHCIPIDPIYLSWKAKKDFDLPIKFIDLADEINSRMPCHVINKVAVSLEKKSLKINGSKILILGLSYKKNIDDCRESPSLVITEKLINLGANISYHDPYFPFYPCQNKLEIPLKCTKLSIKNIESQDCVILLTDHDTFDYEIIEKYSKLIIDTRGKFNSSKKIIKA